MPWAVIETGGTAHQSRLHQPAIGFRGLTSRDFGAEARSAGCHESGSSGAMDAELSNPVRAHAPLVREKSSGGVIQFFDPMPKETGRQGNTSKREAVLEAVTSEAGADAKQGVVILSQGVRTTAAHSKRQLG